MEPNETLKERIAELDKDLKYYKRKLDETRLIRNVLAKSLEGE